MELKEFSRKLATLIHDLHHPIKSAMWTAESDLNRYEKLPLDYLLAHIKDIRDYNVYAYHILFDIEMLLMSLENSWYHFSFEKVQIYDLLKKIESVLPDRILKQKRLSVKIKSLGFLTNRSIFIQCDRLAIEHVFWHILTNAGKFSFQNREICIGIEDTSSKNVTIFIKYYGVPINPEDFPKLTDCEWGIDKIGRLGRALWVIERIMKAHSGSILFSVTGNVTRVKLFFPSDIT